MKTAASCTRGMLPRDMASWSGCEYRHQGKIHISTAHYDSAICSYGEDQDVNSFPGHKDGADFKQYVICIGIMPLSAVTYIERLLTDEQGD
jgi:hypothetical protein